MNKETISIIVPVYNSEKYLKRCIESLVKQIYKHKEIIVVNKSRNIINKYSFKNSSNMLNKILNNEIKVT